MEYEDYYVKELAKLRDNAKHFSQTHPNVARFLGEQSTDPDVERLLQGMAYLLAGTQQRLDDTLPEVLSVFLNAINPEFMRPIPVTTIMQFSPKPAMRQAYTVASETNIDSQPVSETTCRFRTTRAVEVLPLELTQAGIQQENVIGMTPKSKIALTFQTIQVPLSSLKMNRLRLYCHGEVDDSFNIIAHLQQSLLGIEISCGNQVIELPKRALMFSGFDPNETVLQSDNRQLPALHQMIEYFVCPEKFLFWDIDLSEWVDRPALENFTITFLCKQPAAPLPAVNQHNFKLFCVPAINLFELEAGPIMVDHQQFEYKINLPQRGGSIPEIYGVQSVSGVERGTGNDRDYQAYHDFQTTQLAQPTYSHVHRKGDSSESVVHYLQFGYPGKSEMLTEEVIVPTIVCTNGAVAERLEPGTINVATSNTPELVSYENITLPSSYAGVEVGSEQQWNCLSHFVSNFRSMIEITEFKRMLTHYLTMSRADKSKRDINLRRIDGITEITSEQKNRAYQSRFIQGMEITIRVKRDHFSSRGDMICFGMMIDCFFASCRPINSFTQLVFEDIYNGERFEWPIQMGKMPTI